MALSTYNDLLQSIQDWPSLAGEPDLANRAADIVALAEARINRDLRLQGHIETMAVPEVVGKFYEHYDLPDDFNQMDRLEGPDGTGLEQRPAAELARLGVPPSEPCFYAIDGRRLLFSPSVVSFTMRYYKRLPALQSVGSHWLFAKAPDLYLYACLIETGIFSKEPEQEYARYAQAYGAVINSLIAEDMDAMHAKSQPLRAFTGRRGWRAA